LSESSYLRADVLYGTPQPLRQPALDVRSFVPLCLRRRLWPLRAGVFLSWGLGAYGIAVIERDRRLAPAAQHGGERGRGFEALVAVAVLLGHVDVGWRGKRPAQATLGLVHLHHRHRAVEGE